MSTSAIGGDRVTLLGRKYLLKPKTVGPGFDARPEPDFWRTAPLPWDGTARDVFRLNR